jgi:signal peptidase II
VRLGLLTVGVVIGLLLLLAYLARSSQVTWVAFLSLALVWAGGTSNFIDRVTRKGLVTDFVFLRAGPLHTGIFNVADVMIMVGIAALGFEIWKGHRRPDPEKPKEKT